MIRQSDPGMARGGLLFLCRGPLSALILTLCSLGQGSAWAWHTLTHAAFAETAFSNLPGEMQDALKPHLSAILWGAVLPDVLLQDWPNHEWNPLEDPGGRGTGPDRIETLCRSVWDRLWGDPPDLAGAALEMGLISHYLADLSQPLHTVAHFDGEDSIHLAYETDVFMRQEVIPYRYRGAVFCLDPRALAIRSAEEASRFSYGVMRAYEEGPGYAWAEGITAINAARALDGITDCWLTLWELAMGSSPSLALRLSADVLEPGDTLAVVLSALPGRQPPARTDLYVALADPGGGLWFLSPASTFSRDPQPWYPDFPMSAVSGIEVLSVPVGSEVPPGDYTICAVMVAAGADPLDGSAWISAPAARGFSIRPSALLRLDALGDEVYLLPARRPGTEEIAALPLQRWDFIFLGEPGEGPNTSVGEQAVADLIPGPFDHVLVYLGRDLLGRPYGFEINTDLSGAGSGARVVRFPEYELPPGSGTMAAAFEKDIWSNAARWAKRLVPSELALVRAHEADLLMQLHEDRESGLPYQLEFEWSGDFADKAVYLVDDGRAGGSGCTDYWLSVLEDVCGVCIRGTRITAAEINSYFRSDPQGSLAVLPDALNPFPFPVTAGMLLDMGYHAVDPEPHKFPCGGSEVGVPIPSRLVSSPQLAEIEAVQAVPFPQEAARFRVGTEPGCSMPAR